MADPLVGALVADRYRVARALGEGSQPSVYVANHTLIRRWVALQTLSPAMAADPELVRRLLDEGHAVGTLRHPNIVDSLDMGVMPDGRPFLALELLEGTTVAAELSRGRAFDVARACFIGAQVASALGAAHARGVVHRHLAPQSVFLVDRDNHGDHVKVLGFGVTKPGTPVSMAPEVVTHPASVDSRADVFALGAMLYEMLSGHAPLAIGEGEDVLEVIVRRTPAPLGRICPNLPTALIQTVERALHKDRTKRTQTIGEVRMALELFALPSPLSALATTAENPLISAEAPMSDHRSLHVSAETQRHAMLAAAEADRLTAQLAAIAAVSQPAAGARGIGVPLVAGMFGAAAAGVIVFLALRGNVNMQQSTASLARIEPTPTGPARTESGPSTAGATAVGMTTATATQPAAGLAVAPPERAAPPAPAAKAKHEATGRAAADRGDKEKNDPLTAAAAEVSTHSTAGAALAAAAPPPAAPEPAPVAPPALAAAPASTGGKPGILPFGEGMSRPTSISADDIQFTREAREAKVSGVIIVRCLVTTEGANQNCRIMKSVPMMDGPVLAALSNHKGSPVMYQGKPVSVEYTYTIRLKSPD